MEGNICRLPEECMSHVLSLTSPLDSCRSAVVSSTIKSAADSDAVWECFLPRDYKDILSTAVSPVEFSSKKELYFRLCEPLLIDGGKRIFVLDKSTGKKSYMLSARELGITWGDTPQYWSWTSHPGSRFSEVAELLNVCWLEITGKIETAVLSPKTTYVAYLVFKLAPEAHGLGYPSQEASVSVGAHLSKEALCLQSESRRPRRPRIFRGILNFPNILAMHPEPLPPQSAEQESKQVPRERGDGWMEVAMGEFFNDDGIDGEVVDISLLETRGGHWKTGLIVQGIELRPKK